MLWPENLAFSAFLFFFSYIVMIIIIILCLCEHLKNSRVESIRDCTTNYNWLVHYIGYFLGVGRSRGEGRSGGEGWQSHGLYFSCLNRQEMSSPSNLNLTKRLKVPTAPPSAFHLRSHIKNWAAVRYPLYIPSYCVWKIDQKGSSAHWFSIFSTYVIYEKLGSKSHFFFTLAARNVGRTLLYVPCLHKNKVILLRSTPFRNIGIR